MSAARGNANQALYLAKILLKSWADELERAQVPASTLQQAFLPGIRAHLTKAYGWFLLEIRALEAPDAGQPPVRCGELPEIPAGKAIPGELRELQRLESDGWLQDMLEQGASQSPAPRSVGNLADAAVAGADHAEAAAWAAQMESLFSRMRDSLDEY